MTQPPLSRQILVLERVLDVQLLERTSRSVRLTTAGRSFLPETQRILRLAESATHMTRQVAAGRAGSLDAALVRPPVTHPELRSIQALAEPSWSRCPRPIPWPGATTSDPATSAARR